MTDFGNGAAPDASRTPDRSASDAELVCAARRGDSRAFVEIVARYQAMVCGIALGILGDFAASEDAGQEAFLSAWRKFHQLREPARLRAWLAQIARHAALGHLRHQRGHEPLDSAEALADAAPAPDQAAVTEEEAALVRASLAKLSETYRLPLVLYYRDGQSVRAVAEALEISEDAVKQRLARGRDLLRDRMAGLVESVLTRSGPTAIFTMTIAAAIGALTPPSAVAASVSTAASTAAGGAPASSASSASLLTAMSTSKLLLAAAALVAAACIPIGYRISAGRQPVSQTNIAPPAQAHLPAASQPSGPSFEDSALFAEWRALHEKYGTNAAAMPLLYKAIADLEDAFRRRAFHTALVAEWVRVDAADGLKFLLAQGGDTPARRQFFEEWLALDARAAVEALVTGGPGWDTLAREFLPEIARRVPSRVPEIVARLPKAEPAPESGGRLLFAPRSEDTNVREAFAILAERGLQSARDAAQAMTGANRGQALAGVAQVWARSDLAGAIAWARALPDGTDRDEIIRAALVGKAAVDPVAALEQVGLVPAGGALMAADQSPDESKSTGARVLSAAAKADFETTVAWLAAHPGRLGPAEIQGLSPAVTDRLNADAARFLNERLEDGSLGVLLPAVIGALARNQAARAGVWDWLQTQPQNAATMELNLMALMFAGYDDPERALRWDADLPRTSAGDAQAGDLTATLLGPRGRYLHRFDELYRQAPERLRQPLAERGFNSLGADTLDDPQRWIARLALLPETAQAKGRESLARAWTEQSPEEAIGWVASLAPGEARHGSVAAIASAWAAQDAHGAAEWIVAIPPGAERDAGARGLVSAIAKRYPREAWDWALSIRDAAERARAATVVVKMMAARDPAAARQWINAAPLAPEMKTQLQSALGESGRAPGPR